MKNKIFIVAAALTLLSLGAYAVLRRRPEHEPGELGSDDTNNTAPMYPTETKNFKLSEFDCHDGTPVPAALYGNMGELMHYLQILRDYIKLPILVNSGYRTPAYNKKVGGVPDSCHPKGKAADIRVPGKPSKWLHGKILELIAAGKIKDGGLGLYPSFVHYDIGASRRWYE